MNDYDYEQDDTQLEAVTAAQEAQWMALQHVAETYGAPHYQPCAETIQTANSSIHGKTAEGEK